MAYPRKVTDDQLKIIELIARQRLALAPDKVVAHRLGIPIKTLQRWLTIVRRKLQCSTCNTEQLPISEDEIERLSNLTADTLASQDESSH